MPRRPSSGSKRCLFAGCIGFPARIPSQRDTRQSVAVQVRVGRPSTGRLGRGTALKGQRSVDRLGMGTRPAVAGRDEGLGSPDARPADRSGGDRGGFERRRSAAARPVRRASRTGAHKGGTASVQRGRGADAPRAAQPVTPSQARWRPPGSHGAKPSRKSGCGRWGVLTDDGGAMPCPSGCWGTWGRPPAAPRRRHACGKTRQTDWRRCRRLSARTPIEKKRSPLPGLGRFVPGRRRRGPSLPGRR